MRVRFLWLPILIAVLLSLSAGRALAHPAPYSYIDLHLDAGRIHGAVVVHSWDAAHQLGAASPDEAIAPAQADVNGRRLAEALDPRIALLLDGVPAPLRWTSFVALPERESLRLSFELAASSATDIALTAVPFPYDPQHQVFVNVYRSGALAHQAILDASHPAMTWTTSAMRRVSQVLATFIPSGVHHILIGPDHVLFVLALLLAGGGWRRLGLIITAFTLGHSITLGLATFDLVNPPASIVEPAIALSIIVVGLDNLLGVKGGQRRDVRAWAAAAFGLLHGFGFASVLREMALPGSGAAQAWALAGFNVGVEIGQLVVVAIVTLPLALLRRHSHTMAERVVYAASICVVAAGGWWFLERTFLPGGV